MKKFYLVIVTACLLISNWASAGVVSGKKFVNAITAPAITSFSPATGAVGTLVTITGTDLNSPTAFTIGGATAVVVSNTGTSLVGMVMPGAVTGAISVTTSGGTASGGSSFTVTATKRPIGQQGGYIVPPGINVTTPLVGSKTAISADGNTAVFSGTDSGGLATWIYKRSGSTWVLQGSKLVDNITDNTYCVAINADGTTIITSGQVYVLSGGTWIRQGVRLKGTGYTGGFTDGTNLVSSCAISADGNTAAIGNTLDGNVTGAVWVFTRSGSTWTQQGSKLKGASAPSNSNQGVSVALSADGNTLLLGTTISAAYVFARTGVTWAEQGTLQGTVGSTILAFSVALSADGNTAVWAAPNDRAEGGSLWAFTRSGSTWTQQGSKFFGTGATPRAFQGESVSLSADGNVLISGGSGDNIGQGAIWVFLRNAGVWTQQGGKLVGIGTSGTGNMGMGVYLSADGSTAAIGVPDANKNTGGMVIFTSIPSNNADLSGLSLSAGTLTPVLDANTLTYNVSVSSTTTAMTFTPTAASPYAKAAVNGVNVPRGSASASISLATGANIIKVKVTAQDNTTTKTYTINVDRALLPDAETLDASAITQTTATLNGRVDDGGYNTTVDFIYGTSPTLSGATTVAATTGHSIAAGTGPTLTAVSITGLSSNTQYYYKVSGSNSAGTMNGPIKSFTTAAYTNAILSGLAVSTGTFSPAFDGNTTTYSMEVPNSTANIMVTPTTANAFATVKVNGTTVASGSASSAIPLSAGNNPITTLVTAQDGTTTKTYTINVTKLPASFPIATTLSATSVDVVTATLNGEVQDSGFATTVSFVYGTSPTLSGTTTTVAATTGGTISAGAGTTAVSVDLTKLVSNQQYYFRVAATHSGTTTYGDILSFTTSPSRNAILSGLSVSTGTLSPIFGQQTINYNFSVPNTTTSIAITPTASNAFATVKVNGATVASGSASTGISLSEGNNVITTVVTAQDGSTTKTYTINVNRVTGAPLVTTLSASSITAVSATLNGNAADNGRNTTVKFIYGTSSTLSGGTLTAGTLITAGTGPTPVSIDLSDLATATKYYYRMTATNSLGTSTGNILNFTTLPSANAILSNLSVSTGTLAPAFDRQTTSYLLSLPGSTSSITVTPTSSNDDATVRINGSTVLSGDASESIPLNSGNNIINIVVTAQDGSTIKTYTINARTTPVTDPVATTLSATTVDIATATLNGQVQDNGLPATVSFVYGTSSTLSGTTKTVAATTGGTISAGSGTTATAVNIKGLLSGTQYYFRVVANSSGIITNGDIHSFTTLPSRNAILLNLSVTPGTFVNAFVPENTQYSVNYHNTTTSMQVTPTTSNAFATVKVNGVTVLSGHVSAAIPLSVGNNTITTIVTAQDGTTIKVYTIIANRASSGLNAAYYSVLQKEQNPLPASDDNVIVHQALSPNGDGVNDRLAVDGINAYPDNTLIILNRNGVVVYETKGYDNGTKAFDGHSNKTGAMQQAGTYFYTLEYKADGEIKHKTGYIILKY